MLSFLFCSYFLAMSSRYNVLRDHIAEFLISPSSTPSFWFSLNTSYDHDRHLASRFRLDPDDYGVVSPFVAPPSRRLVVPAGCHIAFHCPLIAMPSCCLVTPADCCIASHHPLIALPSCHFFVPAGCRIASCSPLVVPPSCHLVAPACCRIASPCPLVAPRAALLSSRCAGWLFCYLSSCHPLVISSSLHATLSSLLAPAGCRIIISRSPLVAPPSCPLIMLAGCCGCVASPCAALSSSHHTSHLCLTIALA